MIPEGFALPENHPIHHAPHCGITAVAVMCNAPFDKAWAAGRLVNNKRGNWKGRTCPRDRDNIIATLGFKSVLVHDFWYNGRVGCTLKTWARRHAKPGVRYMVTVTGHVCVYQDGYVLDQHGIKPIDLVRWNTKRVVFSHTVEAAA